MENKCLYGWYFIDAICINQVRKATDEKVQQVRLMGDIYRKAGEVSAWLGPICDNHRLS
jgi:hypothetical protein